TSPGRQAPWARRLDATRRACCIRTSGPRWVGSAERGSYVQADLGVDQYLLARRDTVGQQRRIGCDIALHDRERDRAQFEMLRRGADEPDLAVAGHDVGTVFGQVLCRPVEMQQRQPPRWTAQGVYACDRLLAAV